MILRPDPELRARLARLARLRGGAASEAELRGLACALLDDALRERLPLAERIAAARRAHEGKGQ